MRIVLRPVVSSPSRMARWTGAAPRSLGSREKCRFNEATRAKPSTAAGRISPYATTASASGDASASASKAGPDLALSVSRKGSPNLWAATATAVALSCRFLPAGRGTRVMTRAISCNDAARLSSEGTDHSALPRKTTRMGRSAASAGRARPGPELPIADGRQGLAANFALQPVDEQHPVQVIGLVL